MDEAEALQRLAPARVARMATVDAHGSPHVVPVAFALNGRTIYWAVDQKPKRSKLVKRLDNLTQNPIVQIVVDHYDEDWDSLWWVRATGRAMILGQGDERDRALRLLAEKYPQYRSRPPDGAVVAIDVLRVASWDASSGG